MLAHWASASTLTQFLLCRQSITSSFVTIHNIQYLPGLKKSATVIKDTQLLKSGVNVVIEVLR